MCVLGGVGCEGIGCLVVSNWILTCWGLGGRGMGVSVKGVVSNTGFQWPVEWWVGGLVGYSYSHTHTVIHTHRCMHAHSISNGKN